MLCQFLGSLYVSIREHTVECIACSSALFGCLMARERNAGDGPQSKVRVAREVMDQPRSHVALREKELESERECERDREREVMYETHAHVALRD